MSADCALRQSRGRDTWVRTLLLEETANRLCVKPPLTHPGLCHCAWISHPLASRLIDRLIDSTHQYVLPETFPCHTKITLSSASPFF